jgi:hypothetical protein
MSRAITPDWVAADEAPGSRAEQSSLTQRNDLWHGTDLSTDDLAHWIEIGTGYVRSLPPK